MVKNPPALRETWIQSLVWEVPLEKGMATHSSILAWRIPMDRGAWWTTVHKITKSETGLSDFTHTHTHTHTHIYIYIYIHILFHILFNYGLSQDIIFNGLPRWC